MVEGVVRNSPPPCLDMILLKDLIIIWLRVLFELSGTKKGRLLSLALATLFSQNFIGINLVGCFSPPRGTFVREVCIIWYRILFIKFSWRRLTGEWSEIDFWYIFFKESAWNYMNHRPILTVSLLSHLWKKIHLVGELSQKDPLYKETWIIPLIIQYYYYFGCVRERLRMFLRRRNRRFTCK